MADQDEATVQRMANSNLESNKTYPFETMDRDTGARESSRCQRIQQYFKNNVRSRLTRKLFVIILCTQLLSLLLCASGVGSQKLVIDCGAKIPAFQAFLVYMLLAIVFAPHLVCKGEEATKIIKGRWWKYVLLGLIDTEANFAVITAYQYTSLTSVQLLDCLSIPVVVILSIVVLKSKYSPIHFLGIFTCVVGQGFLIWADITRTQSQGDHNSGLVGDLLVVGGAFLYGVSNIAAEFIVKTSTLTEYLAMMSFFACFFSGANVIIFERDDLSSIVWNYEFALYLALAVLPMFALYILMPLMFRYSSAALVNLALLTADLYALFAGLYLFNYTFSTLYIFSLVIIVVGVIIFKIYPTTSSLDVLESENMVNEDHEGSRGSLLETSG